MIRKKQGGRIGVISLGCPKNLVDTEKMLGRFFEAGHVLTPNPEEADLLVVNTCGFIAEAEEESRQAIRDMAAIKARHPGVRLAVTGCLAQRYGRELKEQIPAIDLLLGTHDSATQPRTLIAPPQRRALSVLDPLYRPLTGAPRVLTTPSHTAYLKIAEGCNNPCSFCIIPRLRGPFQSRPGEELVAEARALAAGGVRELNLVSQDTSLYGRDLTPRSSLKSLLTALETVAGIQWIRLLYLYPTLVNDALLDHIAASEKVQPYLDIPLQHSHSAVLARMKRAERGGDIRQLVTRIRSRLPRAAIRTTFIVGFPGETEEEFQDLYEFMSEFKLDHVGIFAYSDEVGTEAHHMPDKVAAELAEARRSRLYDLQEKISGEKLASLVGSTLPVLVEGRLDGSLGSRMGRTPWQAPEVDGHVRLKGENLVAGTIVSAKIIQASAHDLVAEV
ncbi:MAG: 30S ribosomal protein S12 methylthiotransferase RimO [Magnetococcales bacterium]|nr:30S ribosomal protein S12 methylthiotransferase RimO [Magnetococcales bacterium]MBF0632327.1 30S ribosomal protein S12 methylthiotransferase RimO [Magnetococcales bacterium]